MITAIVLAGGRGTRLAAVSGGRPKPSIDVAGRPFIEHVLEHAVATGAERLVLAVSYQWQVLRELLGERFAGRPILWSIEPRPLGTGGAVHHAMSQFGLESAVVINGDTLFRVDLGAMYRQHRAMHSMLTMVVRPVADASRFGAVEVDERGVVVSFREKTTVGPGLINGGVYFIEPAVFAGRAAGGGFSLEVDVLQAQLERIRPKVIVSDEFFIDIGVPEDLARARRMLAKPPPVPRSY